MSWNNVRLSDVCLVKRGTTITEKQSIKGSVPVVAGGISYSYKHNQANRSANVITVSASGANAGYVNFWDVPIFASDCSTVEPIGKDIDIRFIFYFLKNKQDFINKTMRSGAAQPHVYAKDIAQITLKLPPLAEQKRIAEILDKANEIKAKRELALAKLDELAQSTFIDMFGNPLKNNKKWDDLLRLKDIAEIGSGITKGRKIKEQITYQVPYLAVSNVQDKALNLKVVKTINATEEEINRYRLQKNDLLLTEGGDPDKLGRGTLWNNEIDMCIHQNHIFRVRITTEKVTPNFLNWLVGSTRGKEYFLKSAKQTTGIASINMTQLKDFPLLMPPLELQMKFDAIANRIKNNQNQLLKANEKTVGLISALQNQAFTTGFNA